MSGDRVAGILAVLAALLLVSRGVLARRNGGAAISRYALMWAAIFAGLFATALLLARKH